MRKNWRVTLVQTSVSSTETAITDMFLPPFRFIYTIATRQILVFRFVYRKLIFDLAFWKWHASRASVPSFLLVPSRKLSAIVLEATYSFYLACPPRFFWCSSLYRTLLDNRRRGSRHFISPWKFYELRARIEHEVKNIFFLHHLENYFLYI